MNTCRFLLSFLAATWLVSMARAGDFQVIRTAGDVTVKPSSEKEAKRVKLGDRYAIVANNPEAAPAAPEATGFKVESTSGQGASQPARGQELLREVGLKIKIQAGDVKVKDTLDRAFGPARVGSVHPAGCAWRVGPESYVDLELSKNNTLRLQEKTDMTLLKMKKGSTKIVAKLTGGTVEAKLDAFPKGMSFELQTPMGQALAIGTAFRVTYEVSGQGIMLVSLECFDGVVALAGDFIQILDQGLRPGQRLVVDINDTVDSRIVTARFFGQPDETLNLKLWGNEFSMTIPQREEGQATAEVEAVAEVVLKMSLEEEHPLPGFAADTGGGDTPPPPPPAPPPPIAELPQSPAGI